MENFELSENVKYKSNLDKIKSLKKRADELSFEYHQNIEKLKFSDKDVEYIIKKIENMDKKLEKTIVNYK